MRISALLAAAAFCLGPALLPVTAQAAPTHRHHARRHHRLSEGARLNMERKSSHVARQMTPSPNKSIGKHADNLSKNVNHETNRESKDFNHGINNISKGINHAFQGKKKN